MEQSPLSQQTRPDSFKPKVVGHYEELFADEHGELSEGFWRELFLLKPDLSSLQQTLSPLTADVLLHHQHTSQQLLLRSIQEVKTATSPTDDIALDTLTIFLECVLNKKYSSPSSDIISILAGLEGVDTVFNDFVVTLDTTIRNGRSMEIRQKAVRVAIAMVSGAYQTGLISYFMNRDFFPSLIKLVQDSESPKDVFGPFGLLGLLANYNKFEFQNPYRLRFEDFVNETSIKKIVDGIGSTLVPCAEKYAAVQEDQADGWGITSTLSYLGLGSLLPKSDSTPNALSEEDQRIAFAALPPPTASILLATYDFANANKLFSLSLVASSTLPSSTTTASTTLSNTTPFTSFLTITSYLLTHAHRSARTTHYATLQLLTLQILLEDPITAKSLCSADNKVPVRLCRQRLPLPPPVRGDRVLATALMDVIICGISHNLRKRLDIELYYLLLTVLIRLLSFLGRSRTRLAYHWAELWRSLLSLLRFCASYASSLKSLLDMEKAADALVNALALVLSTGEAFLPDAASYDDLFYKVFEAGESLEQFRDAFYPSLSPGKSKPNGKDAAGAASSSTPGQTTSTGTHSMALLLHVSAHYAQILAEQKGKGSRRLSPREVSKIIKQGYETLSLKAEEGLDQWEKYREAERRNLVKRVGRTVVADMRTCVREGL